MANKYIYDAPLEITAEQWLEMLRNDKVFKEQDRNMILAVLQYDGSPHATPIAHAMGLKGRGAINLQVDRLGKRIMKHLPEVLYPKQDNGNDQTWHIPYLGEWQPERNRFLWNLRPALQEAAEIYFAEELKAGKELPSEHAYSKIRRQLFNSPYMDISYKRYIKFKENELYDESYKLETLSRLNELLRGQEINEWTVLDITRKIQKENPSAGSFVHWSNTDSLVKYTEARPAEVSMLLNNLYTSDAPVSERIEKFREQAKTFNPEISLGAPLFGYLLAAKDYTKYPIYKQEVFTKVKKDYEIELKLGSVGQNYEIYRFICNAALDHFKQNDPSLTMLDIQDFFYCSTTYDQIMVESAVDYLYELAGALREFEGNQEQMLEAIADMDPEILEQLSDQYKNNEKINLIRYKLVEKILESGSVSIKEMEAIKEEIRMKYDTNILNSWSNFSVLFQLYYFDKKKKVQEELSKIHRAIRQFEELKDQKFVEDKVLNGFSWNNQFGTSHCWLAVYKTEYPSHRPAPQLFIGIFPDSVEYGLHFGDQHLNGGRRSVAHVESSRMFSYEDFHQKIVEVIGEFNDDSTVGGPASGYPKELNKERWMELIADNTVFFEKDLVYLYKMYEMGGQATATQLAEALGKSRSAFNAPVVSLAKRIQLETGIEDVLRDDGSVCYWCVLFEGEYEENDHFLWRLKPNLKEALAESYEDPTTIKYESYSKEDFLSEVFIDENTYDKISSLLKYKKNIILQGPPGVGKTFVSKRLAYSLMGSKDESRVEMVQFHQNYSYEDFVMGFRPKEDGFSLQYGVFYDFCQRALHHPEEDYYFIIDEINRGNLSKIFGELFMLIERDKRDEFVTMGYSKEKFTVPENMHLIGTMNTADRSLAQIEVALRRRFAFVALNPTFNEKWRQHLINSNVSGEMVSQIHQTIERLNQEIVKDYQLGNGYAIGHSFFSNKPEYMNEKSWFDGIMEFEILPLLEEYYFDRPAVVEQLLEEI
ncbi:AAA family ATPase [Planococcus glaciei]|uniref:AAA family ATPase n=1 Tax=Planococcus glaciei TaxID=459472 RepID=UPI001C73C1A2|nr:AAA family ATPase [Planococcus glaciei]MBX0314656.1 AAA family ATPase [Planococcus glaciei]